MLSDYSTMIPLSLQLKNFLSYGEPLQTITFGHYHLICLSGKNGHGKSALLDAITWAVWGQARKTLTAVKPDAALMRMGSNHMVVIFDFLLHDTHYRIRREYCHNHGKGYAVLEFGIIHEPPLLPVPLTDKTIRATQAVIDRIIGIDYESFINSTFLRQGNANEFSKKSPKDRKEILACILGLDTYEKVRKKALERARVAHSEKQLLLSLQEQLKKSIEQKIPLQQELDTVHTTIDQYATTAHDTQAALMALEETIAQQNALKQRYEIGAFHLHDSQKKYHTLKEQLTATYRLYQNTRQKLQSNISKEHLINEYQQQKQALSNYETQIADIRKKKETLTHLVHKKTALHQEAEKKKLVLVHERRIAFQEQAVKLQQIEAVITERNQRSERIISELKTINQNKIHAQNNIVSADAVAIAQTIKNRIEKASIFVHTYTTKLKKTGEEIETLPGQLSSLAQAMARCPLCLQHISCDQQTILARQIASKGTQLKYRTTRLQKTVRILKNFIEKKQEEYTTLIKHIEESKKQEQIVILLANTETQLITERNAVEHELGTLETEKKKQKELYHTQEQLLHEATNLSLSETLQTYEGYNELCATIGLLEKELAYTDDPTQKYQTALEQCNLLEHNIHHHEGNDTLAFKAMQYRHQITDIIMVLKTLKNQITVEQDAAKQCAEHEKQLLLLNREKNRLLELCKQNDTAIKNTHAQKVRIETTLEHITTIEKEINTQQSLLTTLTNDYHDYLTLGQALGKDGIQALLIEEAIPEIEHEANILLAKLTNNQAYIMIDSLRDLKNGTTKETLDIKIADHYGIRPYELFSGGEAFRIDFALRIALSKLVARRAGTTLQTLIIDEGFGSQDEEGLTLIMDALYKIQDDFSKIIIVSHLNSFKEQFPVHFIVQKGPTGSAVTVCEYA